MTEPRGLEIVRKRAIDCGWSWSVVHGHGTLDVRRLVDHHFVNAPVDVESVSLRMQRGSQRCFGIWTTPAGEPAAYWMGGWTDLAVLGSLGWRLTVAQLTERILGHVEVGR